MDLLVMSFNIRCSTARGDGDNWWPHRKEKVVSLIKAYNPGVLCIQEGCPDQIECLDPQLSEYTRFGRGRDIDGGEHAAVYLKKGLFNILDTGNFWLSETPDVPGSRHWGNNCVRMATWVKAKPVNGSSAIMVVNTHLDHESEEARQKGIRLINSFIEASEIPTIFTGDMNAEPNSVPIKYITGETEIEGSKGALKDTRDNSGYALSDGTFHGFSGKPHGIIDYIFTTPAIGTKEFKIITDKIDNRYPSDHFPITALLSL